MSVHKWQYQRLRLREINCLLIHPRNLISPTQNVNAFRVQV